VPGYQFVGLEDEAMPQFDDVFQVYPNPATTNATVTIQLKNESNVELKVIDMTGKEVAARNYGAISGASAVDINTSNFQAGVYLIELTIDAVKMTKKLIVK
jgi:hypothetical protein